MTISEKLFLGLIVSIIGWIVIHIITFYVKRYRYGKVLLLDISFYILISKECMDFFNKYFNKFIVNDNIIDKPLRFTMDEFDLFKSIQNDIFNYFSSIYLVKIFKIYNALMEVNVLMDGLAKDILKLYEEKKTLDGDEISYLKRKKDRISALVNILTRKEFKKLRDLPEDYRGRISPQTIIT
jgi:hypothetical protein